MSSFTDRIETGDGLTMSTSSDGLTSGPDRIAVPLHHIPPYITETDIVPVSREPILAVYR